MDFSLLLWRLADRRKLKRLHDAARMRRGESHCHPPGKNDPRGRPEGLPERGVMNNEGMKSAFNDIAQKYDSQRKSFIPCFEDYYGTSSVLVSRIIRYPGKILDLGAGTGLLSRYYYELFPDSAFELTDISEKMLEVARKRFYGKPNFSFNERDYVHESFQQGYDLILSGLSLHHLSEKERKGLFKKIFSALNPHGVFVNHDQYNAPSLKVNNAINDLWYEMISRSGLPEEEIEKWKQRRALDCETTVNKEMEELKETGFEEVECLYSCLKFGVVMAMKNMETGLSSGIRSRVES